MTLLKYALIGFVGGAVVVALVVIVVNDPSSFFSKNSSWFGMEKEKQQPGSGLRFVRFQGSLTRS